MISKAINALIATLTSQLEEIRRKDQTIRSASLKEADSGSTLLPAAVHPAKPEGPAIVLNHRQRKAWAAIMAQGRITRSRYQEIIGGNLPTRTAIYDLQDLVSKGVLKKTGRGPATHYIVSEAVNSGQC
jgi:predicted HTH transcriptional regulator